MAQATSLDEAKKMMEERTPNRIVYISWAESCSRSDHVARELGGRSFMVYIAKLGSHPATILFKYLGQSWKTWRILWRERPTAVFVMSPPVVAVLAVYFYCCLARIPYITDCHTAAFLHPRWRRLQWLQHALERRAATNIVHNEHLEELVKSKGAPTTLVRDVPVVYSGEEAFEFRPGFSVAVVCSFNADEPIESIFEAAARIPEVQFYMTGNPKHLPTSVAEKRPPNVTLTGFLSDAAYGHLIAHAGAVMSLTTRDHTMLRGAWEAIYQGTPVIISNWPILLESFDKGALHVDNSPDDIVRAVKECEQSNQELRVQATAAREERINHWRSTRESLLHAVGGAS